MVARPSSVWSFSGPFCTSAVKAEFALGALRLAGARLYPKLVRSKAHFVEPMLLLRKEQLPDDPNWLLELKLDGYRALAIQDRRPGPSSLPQRQ